MIRGRKGGVAVAAVEVQPQMVPCKFCGKDTSQGFEDAGGE